MESSGQMTILQSGLTINKEQENMRRVRQEISKEDYERGKQLKNNSDLKMFAEEVHPDIIQWWVYWIYFVGVEQDKKTGKYYLWANIGDSCD